MSKMPPLVRQGFTLGVKTSYDPSSVPFNAIWESRNVRSDQSGILRLRPGVDQISSSLGHGSMQALSSAFDKILAVWNRNVYLFNTDGTNTQIGTNLIGSGPSDDAEIIRWARNGAELNYLFAGNGIYETDGQTTALSTPYSPASGESPNLILNATTSMQDITSGPAKCKFAVIRTSLSQRLCAAGDPDSPNSVYMSGVLDGTYWPDDQVIQLPDDGGEIIGLWNWYNALIIFRDKDVWAFFGSDLTDAAAELVLQDASTGCISHRTIVEVPKVGIVFLGADNIYALQQVTAIENQAKAEPIGDDVRKYVLKNLDYLTGCSAVYYNREYILNFPNSPQDERVFRLNLQNGANWYMDTGPNVDRYLVHERKLYGTQLNDGTILEFTDSLLDNGAGIPFYVSFRREDLQPGPSRIKKVYIYVISKARKEKKPLYFFGTTFGNLLFNNTQQDDVNLLTGTEQHLNVSLVVDGNTFSVENFKLVADRLNYQQLEQSEPIRIYEARIRPSLKGNLIQLRINATTPGEDIAIVGYGVEYANRDRIHGRNIVG